MTRRSRKADNAERCIYAFRPNKLKKVTVKTRRYKQDAKDKAFRRGAYSNVRDPRKTQSDNVLRSIYAFRSVERKREPLPADLPQGAYSNVSDQGKTQGRQSIATYIRVSPHLNQKSHQRGEVGEYPHRLLPLQLPRFGIADGKPGKIRPAGGGTLGVLAPVPHHQALPV